jgi:hypothetical protein
VSDSKKRDVSLKKTDTASKNGPMTELGDVTKMKKMSKSSMTSKNLTIAETGKSGTSG